MPTTPRLPWLKAPLLLLACMFAGGPAGAAEDVYWFPAKAFSRAKVYAFKYGYHMRFIRHEADEEDAELPQKTFADLTPGDRLVLVDFGDTYTRNALLRSVLPLVEQGSRVIWLVVNRYQVDELNDFLADNLGFMMYKGHKYDDEATYTGAEVSHLWGGLTLETPEAKKRTISNHFFVNNAKLSRASITDTGEEDGRAMERITSVLIRKGKGELLAIASPQYSSGSDSSIFDNSAIDLSDNTEALIRMLKWTVDGTDTIARLTREPVAGKRPKIRTRPPTLAVPRPAAPTGAMPPPPPPPPGSGIGTRR